MAKGYEKVLVGPGDFKPVSPRMEKVKDTTAANFWTGIGASAIMLALGLGSLAFIWIYDTSMLWPSIARYGVAYLLLTIAAGLLDFGRSSRLRHMARVWEVHGDRQKAMILIGKQKELIENHAAKLLERGAKIDWLQTENANLQERLNSRDAELQQITKGKRSPTDPLAKPRQIRPLDHDIEKTLDNAIALIRAADAKKPYGRQAGPVSGRQWYSTKDFLVGAGVGLVEDTKRGQVLKIPLTHGVLMAEQALRGKAREWQSERNAGVVKP